MSNDLYEIEEITLEDGTKITLKPSTIKVLRKGTALLSTLGDPPPENDEEAVHRLLDIVCLCVKKQRPDFEKEVEEDGVKKTVVDYDLMEELFDIEQIWYVIEKDLGVKLNDPNLLAETAANAAKLMAMNEEQNSQT